MHEFDLWKLLAGIGIFLFGIFLLEEAIKKLSGRAFKNFIRKSTDSPLKAVGAGTIATAILQSSSAVSLMLLAFVGAGVMGIQSAIGVILGANLGSTFTAWIIATLGFKIQIDAFALPLVAIGSLSLLFSPAGSKWKEGSKALTGFGFLFMGLDFLKTSVDFLAGSIDLQMLPDWGIVSFLLLGFLLTAVVQSSAAAMAIALSGIHAGIMSFEEAAIIVIGINLGTTITVLLGSFNSSAIKKRVAFSHVTFNLCTGILALIILPVLIWLVSQVFSTIREPVMALALFHSLFNLTGIILFLPLIKLLALLAKKLFPDRKTTSAIYLNQPAAIDPAAGLTPLCNEVKHLLLEAVRHNLTVLQIPLKPVLTNYFQSIAEFNSPTKKVSAATLYAELKLLQTEIISFAVLLQQKELNPHEVTLLGNYLDATQSAVQSAKILKDVQHEFERLQGEDNLVLNRHFEKAQQKQMDLYQSFAGLINNTNPQETIDILLDLNRQIEAEDHQFLNYLAKLVREQGIDPDFISTLISANRGFVFSVQQLIRAITALKIQPGSDEIFD